MAIDSNNDGTIDSGNDGEDAAEESSPGMIIGVNDDDDDSKADKSLEVKLDVPGHLPDDFEVHLRMEHGGTAPVSLWLDDACTQPVPQSMAFVKTPSTPIPEKIYLLRKRKFCPIFQ